MLPDIWYGNGGPWEDEMQPGGSESPMGGPVYHYDAANPSETKFPAYYDDHWFPYEWGRDWIKETALDGTGGPLEVSAFLDDPAFKWENPMDMEFGPDGSLYVLDYGGGFFGGDASSALYRVDYVQGGRRPIAVASAEPDLDQREHADRAVLQRGLARPRRRRDHLLVGLRRRLAGQHRGEPDPHLQRRSAPTARR